jgi:hypothetical protein
MLSVHFNNKTAKYELIVQYEKNEEEKLYTRSMSSRTIPFHSPVFGSEMPYLASGASRMV